MKLKCVNPYDGGYLTTGKIYDVVSGSDSSDSYVNIICDDGDEINVYVPSSAHGKFEVIYED